ncbi:MAG: hypothetical protein EA402_12610 [Planctomycetota bacterium]|nr:MAG: hypothetical protein EA402_12610 [Planctomycetota bacterium]
MKPKSNSALIAVWRGRLLWPCALDEAPVIDCRELECLGTWAYEWLREHPGCAMVGAHPELKRQLSQAQLPILWYKHLDQVPSLSTSGNSQRGVGPDERALLWGDE